MPGSSLTIRKTISIFSAWILFLSAFSFWQSAMAQTPPNSNYNLSTSGVRLGPSSGSTAAATSTALSNSGAGSSLSGGDAMTGMAAMGAVTSLASSIAGGASVKAAIVQTGLSLGSSYFSIAATKDCAGSWGTNPECWFDVSMAVGLAVMAGKAAKQKNAADNSKLNADQLNNTIGAGKGSGGIDLCNTPDCYKLTNAQIQQIFPSGGPIQYDPKKGTVTMKGKSYKESDFDSADAMKRAGIDPKAISTIMDTLAKAEKDADAKLAKMAADQGGGLDENGSGGGSAAAAAVNAANGMNGTPGIGGSGKNTSALDRNPAAAVAGMAKNFNGESIGVSGDSIFAMVNRRYNKKAKEDAFYKDANPSPASSPSTEPNQ